MNHIWPDNSLNPKQRDIEYTKARIEWWCENHCGDIQYEVYITEDSFFDDVVLVKIGSKEARVMTIEKNSKIAWWLGCVLKDARLQKSIEQSEKQNEILSF
jgi:hypothetical protein